MYNRMKKTHSSFQFFLCLKKENTLLSLRYIVKLLLPMDHALSNQRYVLLFLSCKEGYCLSSFFLASNHCIRLVYFITYCISSLKISCKMLVVILVYEDYFRGEAKYEEYFICFLYNTANESFF